MRIKLTGRPATPPALPWRIIAIDPGTTQSAYMEYFPKIKSWGRFGKVQNSKLLKLLCLSEPDMVVCEDIQSMGMAVGRSTFKTCKWIGRYQQLCASLNIPFRTIYRSEEKRTLCQGVQRPKDTHIRAALIKLYGEPGTAKAPGRTYGLSGDTWSALSVAHTFVATFSQKQ